MLKLSESALAPRFVKSSFQKIKSAVKTVNNDPHPDFFPTPKKVLPTHPLAGYNENATRGIVPFKRGLKGKPMNQIPGFHKKVDAPEPRIVREHAPTAQTTDKIDNYHHTEPTNSTYKKIRKAIAA